MATTVGTALLKIIPDLSTLGRDLQTGVSSGLKTIGANVSQAGRAITMGVTLPIVGLGVAAVKTAMDWESAFAGVRKTLEATPAELAEIEQGLRDMSKQIPTSAEDLAGIAEAAGALGIAKEDVLGFTRVVADMAETTDLTSEAAATAFGQLGNVLSLTGDDFEHLGSTLVDLGNKGSSTESQIADLMLRIAGVGKSVGLTTAEIAGMAAALANAGIPAERGGTAISTTFARIAKEVETAGPKLALFAKLAGQSVEDFSRDFRDKPAEAFGRFIDGLERTQESGEGLFTTLDELGIKGRREAETLILLAQAQGSVAKTVGIATNAWRQNTALAAEAEKRYATTAAKLDVFKNTAKDALVTLGNALLPVLQSLLVGAKPIIDFLATLFEIFGKLPRPVQILIVAFMGFLAAIGPILMIAGALISAVGSIAAVFGVTAAAVVGAIAVTTAAIFGIGLVVGVIVFLIVKHWDTLKRWTMTAFNAIVEFFKRFWPILLGIFTGGIGLLVLLIVRNWDTVKRITAAVWNAIRAVLATVWGWIRTAATTYFNAYRAIITAAWNAIRAATSAIWNAIRGVISAAWNAIRGVVSAGVNAIRSIISSAWAWLRSSASAAWNAVVGAFQSAYNRIAGIVSRIKNTFCNLPFVPCSPIPLVEDAKAARKGVLAELSKMSDALPPLTMPLRVPVAQRMAGRIAADRYAGAPSLAGELAGLRADLRALELTVHQRIDLDGREIYRNQQRHRAFDERARK